MSYCPACGRPHEVASRFCPHCGAARQSAPDGPPTRAGAPATGAAGPPGPPGPAASPWGPASAGPASSPQSQRTLLLLVGAGLALVLVVGLTLAAVLSGDDAEGDRADKRALQGDGGTRIDGGDVDAGGYDGSDSSDDYGDLVTDYYVDESSSSVSGVTDSYGSATIELSPPAGETLTVEVYGDSDLVLSTIDIDTGEEISSDEIVDGTESIEITTLSDDPWTITVRDYSDLADQSFTLSFY